MSRDPVAAFLGTFMVLAIGIVLIALAGRKLGIVGIALIALGLRGARGVQSLLTGEIDDAAAYDNFAVNLANHWQNNGPDPGAWLGKDGFPAILAAIYSYLGHAPEIGYAINAVVGGLAVVVVAATTAQMGWGSAVRPAAWIVALWPVGIVWGGALLRESIVTLLLAVGLWGTVRLYQLYVGSGALAIAAAGLAMMFMRGGLAFLILIGMPLVAAIATNLRNKASMSRWALGAGVMVVAVLAFNVLNGYFAEGRFFEYRPEVSLDQNSGTSSFAAAGLGKSALNQSLFAHVLRVPTAAIGPLPWTVTNLSLLQAFLDGLLWIIVWTSAIFATIKLAKRADALLFTLPILSLVVAIAANASNFGLIVRLRGQGIVLIAPLAALGFVYWRERRARKRAEKLTRTVELRQSTRARVRARSAKYR